MSRFCCYRSLALFNYNRYFCTGAFFDLIEWLKDYFLDLYSYLIVWTSTMFWHMLGWVIHHFWWEEDFSRTPVSYRYTNSIELVPRFGFVTIPSSGQLEPNCQNLQLWVVPSRNWKTWNPEPRTWQGSETLFCTKPNPEKWCDDVTKGSPHLYQVPGKSLHFWKY